MKYRLSRTFVFGFLCFTATVVTTAQAQEDVPALVARLSANHPRANRIAAAKSLLKITDREALLAVGALSAACKDEDRDVRLQCVITLGLLLNRHKQQCPMILVEAMFDPDADVRTNSSVAVMLLEDRLPKNALPLLLKHAAHRDAWVRSYVLRVLASQAKKTPRSSPCYGRPRTIARFTSEWTRSLACGVPRRICQSWFRTGCFCWKRRR